MKIFIGYENEYPESFEVCAESIRRFNQNHEIIPLVKSELEEKTFNKLGDVTHKRLKITQNKVIILQACG